MGHFYYFNRWYISERMGFAITNYLKHGAPTGDFLAAVICNDLFEAVGRADDENIENLPAFCAYFYNEAPASSYGSKKIMDQWIAMHRKLREDKQKYKPKFKTEG